MSIRIQCTYPKVIHILLGLYAGKAELRWEDGEPHN